MIPKNQLRAIFAKKGQEKNQLVDKESNIMMNLGVQTDGTMVVAFPKTIWQKEQFDSFVEKMKQEPLVKSKVFEIKKRTDKENYSAILQSRIMQ